MFDHFVLMIIDGSQSVYFFPMCSEMFVDTFCSVSFTAVERLGFVLRIKNRSDDLV